MHETGLVNLPASPDGSCHDNARRQFILVSSIHQWIICGISYRCFPKNRMWILVHLTLFFMLPRGNLEGLLGSVARGLQAENPCFGIIVCILTEVPGLAVIATYVKIIHLIFPSSVSGYSIVECGKPSLHVLTTKIGEFSHLLFLRADFQKSHLSEFSLVDQRSQNTYLNDR